METHYNRFKRVITTVNDINSISKKSYKRGLISGLYLGICISILLFVIFLLM